MASANIEEAGLDPDGVAHGVCVGAAAPKGDRDEADRTPADVCIWPWIADGAATWTASPSDPATRLRPQAVQRMTEARSSASQWGQSFTQGVSTPRETCLRADGVTVRSVRGKMGVTRREVTGWRRS